MVVCELLGDRIYDCLWLFQGKMLIYGAMLQCLDPVLTIAAALSCGRPMFMSPLEKREEAKARKSELYAPLMTSKSDHMAMVLAHSAWMNARNQGKFNFNSSMVLSRSCHFLRRLLHCVGGDRAGFVFSKQNFLSEDVMQATLASKKEFARILIEIGFVSRDYIDNVRAQCSRSPLLLAAVLSLILAEVLRSGSLLACSFR